MRSCFHRQQSRGGGGVAPQQKFLGAEPTHVLVLKNTFTDVFGITCEISDLRAHIFCP